LNLISKIASLQSTITAVSRQSQQLWSEKQEVAGRLQRLLLATGEGVRDMQHKCGIEVAGPSEDELSVMAGEHAGGVEGGAVGVAGGASAAGAGLAFNGKRGAARNAQSSGGTKRSPKTFVAVSLDEFESVSDLVRGRVKLEEVNHVYETLHTFFKENRKKRIEGGMTISTKDMSAMGLKITGATGEARLKVLRQLKLLTISTRDKSVELVFE
jgi:hypothetical protein